MTIEICCFTDPGIETLVVDLMRDEMHDVPYVAMSIICTGRDDADIHLDRSRVEFLHKRLGEYLEGMK